MSNQRGFRFDTYRLLLKVKVVERFHNGAQSFKYAQAQFRNDAQSFKYAQAQFRNDAQSFKYAQA
jgi:hypothetical protein